MRAKRVEESPRSLTRNDRERSAQIEHLIGVMTSIRERNVIEGENGLGEVVDDWVAAFNL
jgi:hypothetical protein